MSKRSAEIPKIVAFIRSHADYCTKRIAEIDAELATCSDAEQASFLGRWRSAYGEKWAVLGVIADRIEAGEHLKGDLY